MHPLCRLAGLSLSLSVPATAAMPDGSQFQINAYTTNTQRDPRIALIANGDFFVVWSSIGSAQNDLSDYSIQGVRFDSTGEIVGEEFQINTYTTAYQGRHAISSDLDGNFVVVWRSLVSPGNDIGNSSIQAQRFDPAGEKVGQQLQVNSFVGGQQDYPSVAVCCGGQFVVVWSTPDTSGDDFSSYSIAGKLYNSSGTAVGDEFQVNTFTTDRQDNPTVAMDIAGNFVVAWVSEGSAGNDVSSYSIQAQRFSSALARLGSEFQVNAFTTSAQFGPAAAYGSGGEFVVAWASYGSFGNDSSSASIQGQRYDQSGITLGSQFQVNSCATGAQRSARVATDLQGSSIVTWESACSGGDDNSVRSVQGQRFGASGAKIDGQFQVNSYTTNFQGSAAVATRTDGNFAVTWASSGSSESDLESTSIQAQRYAVRIFSSGFESAQDCAWTEVFGGPGCPPP